MSLCSIFCTSVNYCCIPLRLTELAILLSEAWCPPKVSTKHAYFLNDMARIFLSSMSNRIDRHVIFSLSGGHACVYWCDRLLILMLVSTALIKTVLCYTTLKLGMVLKETLWAFHRKKRSLGLMILTCLTIFLGMKYSRWSPISCGHTQERNQNQDKFSTTGSPERDIRSKTVLEFLLRFHSTVLCWTYTCFSLVIACVRQIQ